MKQRIWGCATLAFVVATLVPLIAAPANASTESNFVSLVNQERTSRGLRAEQVASDVVAVARRHSARMAAEGRIWHNPSLGSQVSNWEEVGENVGRGPSVEKIHSAFMASASHRANILERNDNIIGVGVAKGSDGRIYVTQIFVQRKMASRSTYTPVRRGSAPQPVFQSAATPPKAKPKPPKTRAVEVLVRLVEFD